MTDDFTTFVGENQASAHRLALALCGGDAYEAKDLVQAALERIWMRWSKLALDDQGAYLRTVVVNTHTSTRRKGWWNRERVTGQVPEQPITGAQDGVQGVIDSHVLLAGLARLPLRQRQAVVLRYLEDLSVADVARLMACSPGTVKRAAFDGLRTLRAQIVPNEAEEVTDVRH